jgi:ketosteroid isomerase-like protein
MSSAEVEAFERGADAINRLDADELADLVHENGVFEPLRAATEGAYIGPEGMRRFVADTIEAFDVFDVTLDEVTGLGNGRVLAIGTIRMRGRGSGFENDVTTAAVAEFRDGRLARYKDFGDPRLARQAAAGDW